MLTIGFQQEYYTLWSVNDNGIHGVRVMYHHNLSKNMEEAVAKVEKLTDNYEIDLSLCGSPSQLKSRPKYSAGRFQFGKSESMLFGDVKDYGWISWYYRATLDSRFGEPEALKSILLEQGFHFDNDRVYSPKQWEKHLWWKSLKDGHFFEQGQRVQLELKQIHSTSFETQYGTCHVITYIDKDNRILKYKGGSPFLFCGSMEDRENEEEKKFHLFTGTIKHSEYRDTKQTLIQRMKLV